MFAVDTNISGGHKFLDVVKHVCAQFGIGSNMVDT